MAELFKRLEKTSALLSSAIDQYLDACVAIGGYPRLSFAGVSRAFFDRVAGELPLATSYETKIKQAKATIGYTINSSSPIPHINSLPSEILTRVFYMVTDTCGLMRDVGNSIPLPRYPEFLSHVCTRWREIALDSPRLWAHIDLVRLSAPNHGFKSRAETFVSRAGSTLLDVHLYEQADCYKYDRQSMLDIVTLTALQTRSLELVARHVPGYGPVPRLLEHCFHQYVPGMLTKLHIIKEFDPSHDTLPTYHFIDSIDRSNHPLTSTALNVTEECLDTLLLPVTRLQLDSIYFPWTHQAYHGLLELRLFFNGEHEVSMTKLEFVGILASSPRLKLLHFEITISDEPAVGPVVSPVRLDDLEVLILHPSDDEKPHFVLSLLAPGPQPLRFSFSHDDIIDMSDSQQEWLTRVKEFFENSNIIELRLLCLTWPPLVGPEHLLESLPNLRVLILDGCCDDPYSRSLPPPPLNSDPLQLDVLYMVGCSIDLGKLTRTLQHIRAERVVFWKCDFSKATSALQFCNDYDKVEAELRLICPSFIWVDRNKPSPTNGWDEL